jgi:hypothetical protein
MPTQPQDLNLATIRIIWGAMIMSLVIFAFVLVHLDQLETVIPGSFNPNDQAQMIPMMGFSSLLLALFLYRTRVAPIEAMPQRALGYILTWVMLESVAVMGFAGSFLSGNGFYFLLNGMVALVGYLATFPREKAVGAPKRPY